MESTLLHLYYRQGCHLCDEMWQHLQQIHSDTTTFEVELVDVDSTAELKEKYGILIPVLEADGEVICNYYLDPVALEQYLVSVRKQ